MKNILLPVNSIKHEMNEIDFACYIANLSHSKLTGVFMEDIPEPQIPILKTALGFPYVETIIARDIPENEEKMKSCSQNIHVFKEACLNRGVSCDIHQDLFVPVKEVIAESRFADLIIVNAETSFESKPENIPTRFVKDVLARSECPVVIAPLSFDSIDEILFTYNGSPSSVFAINQFAYLFPELENKKVTLLEVQEKDRQFSEDQDRINDLISRHYSSIHLQVLKGKARDELFGYLLGKKNTFVIMGAFGRSLLSDLIRPSAGEFVTKVINLPIFIAHC